MALTLDQKLKLFTQLHQFCSTYFTQLLSLSKHMVKSAGKCGDTWELNMVCEESNEINGEKNCFEFYRWEKNCLLLIRSEKNCTFKLGVEKKSLTTKENHSPPTYQMVRPLGLNALFIHDIYTNQDCVLLF